MERLKEKTDTEIARMMNDVVSVFDKQFRGRGNSGMNLKFGFLTLNKEATRRGLVIGKDKFGQIILEQKKEEQ